ncbi:MAG: TRAP transporter small permease [Firmicutes bacterium]|jgi:TRAP-type C4-dicarboxylate transport system permease small subunit|nr:TRAP transporter small permease [Bacillota bacterium]
MLRKRFDELVENAATAVFVFMFLVTAMQVILRFVFQRPFMWTEEAARFLYVWLTFLGAAVIMRDNEHITIDFLVKRLPRKVQLALSLCIRLAIVVYCVVVFMGSLIMIRINWDAPSSTMPNVVTMAHVYLAVPVGMTLLIYYVLRDLPAQARALFSKTASKEAKLEEVG